MTDDGTVLFARYAYPPNELGYCGPAGAEALLRPGETAEIARRARRFEGAWAYLEFIARAAGIADPLDVRVVQAYWVGNDLLDAVPGGELVGWLRERFTGQPGGTWQEAGPRALAHHSFQVYEVYPWAALLKRHGHPTAVSVLDRCRIRTGTVLSVGPGTAVVRSRPLVWTGRTLTAGDPVDEAVRWAADGRTLLGGLSPGDRVTLHWDWVCDVVSDEQTALVDRLDAGRQDALFGARARAQPV